MRYIENVSKLLAWVAGAFIALMLIITVLDVFGKYALNTPFKGTLEIIAYYCMIGSVFLALPYINLKNEHISSDIIYGIVSDRKKKFLDAFGIIISLLFFCLFSYYMWLEAYRSFAIREEAFGSVFIPIWPSKMMMPIGLILSCIVILSFLRRQPVRTEESISEE